MGDVLTDVVTEGLEVCHDAIIVLFRSLSMWLPMVGGDDDSAFALCFQLFSLFALHFASILHQSSIISLSYDTQPWTVERSDGFGDDISYISTHILCSNIANFADTKDSFVIQPASRLLSFNFDDVLIDWC